MRKLDLDFVHPLEGDFGWAQRAFVEEVERQYNAGLPVRIITLKARQLGISTVTEAILFLWTFIYPGSNELVISHENGPAQELFMMTKLYWDTWPHKDAYSLQYSTKQQLRWAETKSQLRVATAKNVQSGRGSTIQAVHASEAAFYDDPKTLFTGLAQTVPHRHGTIEVIESTANGVGNWFYEEWQHAEQGESDFIPLFFPWWKHPEYEMATTLTIKSELDPDERKLLIMGASMENIAWRRWAIKNKAGGDIDDFMQEYPSTPEEAFITSGRPIFIARALSDCYKPELGYRGKLIDLQNGSVKFIPDREGNLTIFRAPKRGDTRWDRYFCAGDPSETIAGDPACIQVINRATYEQVAVWHGRMTPVHFAREMMRLGKYYNTCELCPEVEGGGQAAIGAMIQAGYPRLWTDKRPDRVKMGNFNVFGWSTNYQRKMWCIGDLQRLVIDNSLIIHDKKTFYQLRNYVQFDNGELGNSSDSDHDDAVMALAIGVAASKINGPFLADGPSGNVVVDIYRQEFDGEAM